MYKPEIKITVEEIQRVHDLLHPLVTGEDGPYLPPEIRKAIENSLAPLCWILGHEPGETFKENIKKIEEELKRQGYVMMRSS
jgi:hypothetical protein